MHYTVQEPKQKLMPNIFNLLASQKNQDKDMFNGQEFWQENYHKLRNALAQN